MNNTRIILAADHAGFAMKEDIKSYLSQNGYAVEDVGAEKLIDGDDYPQYMAAAAKVVSADHSGNVKAIIFGGSGEGEAIVANRFTGVRAAVWNGGSDEIVKLSRQHNDANVLSIGARFVDVAKAKEIIDLWLNTPFGGEERHERRIAQIDQL
ncbi:MAG: RpiB/LacA/LacB family sugar-phosphate isomerase [Patescibacteria group bacterium]|nr:RpiB/LacA/LacB family sugar-phosphate isomerase [Patescibacteria group bacterium]